MSQISYVGQVLDDGRLSVSRRVTKAMGLRPGDRLRVTLARDTGRGEPLELQPIEDFDREDLERIAAFRFSRLLQRRMEQLLVKNQAGTMTAHERTELQRLSHESLIQCARKAQARFLLSQRPK